MSVASDLVVRQGEKDITFIQILEVPKDVVFTAFSSAEHLRKWWMPEPCVMTECTVDFRPGGKWDYEVEVPGGERHRARVVYEEIIPEEKIVAMDYFLDSSGKILEGLPSKRLTITFDGAGNETELKVHIQLQSAAERQKLVGMGFVPGFTTAIKQLIQFIS